MKTIRTYFPEKKTIRKIPFYLYIFGYLQVLWPVNAFILLTGLRKRYTNKAWVWYLSRTPKEAIGAMLK